MIIEVPTCQLAIRGTIPQVRYTAVYKEWLNIYHTISFVSEYVGIDLARAPPKAA
jgi:hypothetical protein